MKLLKRAAIIFHPHEWMISVDYIFLTKITDLKRLRYFTDRNNG